MSAIINYMSNCIHFPFLTSTPITMYISLGIQSIKRSQKGHLSKKLEKVKV